MRLACGPLALRAFCILVFGLALAQPLAASPWAEVGDEVLREDIEVLQAYGLIKGPVTSWPLPWGQISAGLQVTGEEQLPVYVQRSLSRVKKRLRRETETGRLKAKLKVRVTSEPAVVRGFDVSARDEVDVRGQADYMGERFAARLGFGYQGDITFNSGRGALDDSYAAFRLGNWLFYGGVLDAWWGPGRVSSLILSNNTRPIPRFGVMRYNPTAFEWPVLNLLGPWQINAFFGILDDDRTIENPYQLGFRGNFSPLPGLEIGVSRMITLCGNGNECDFLGTLTGTEGRVGSNNISNEVGSVDARFSSSLLGNDYAIYGQIIGEESGSFALERLSVLYGMTLRGGLGPAGARWRLTGEYSDTMSILNDGFTGSNVTYNHTTFGHGYRYRGRAIGHSLDGDSDVISFVASLTDIRSWTYRLGYHHTRINRDSAGLQTHSVSRNRETINIFEASLSVPWRRGLFDIGIRLRDDAPNTTGESELEIAGEIGWSVGF